MIHEQVERFIRRHIRSMSALELLLYLREHADADTDAARLAAALRGNAAALAGMLAFFKSRGLLAENAPGMFRYLPGSAGDEAVLTELARDFRERPVALMDIILAAPSDTIRSFADAFRLKE